MTMSSASPQAAGWWTAWTFIGLLALIGLVAIMVRASIRRPDEARYKRMQSDSFYNEGEADTKYWRTRYTLSQRERRGAPAFDLAAMATAVRGKEFDPWHPGRWP